MSCSFTFMKSVCNLSVTEWSHGISCSSARAPSRNGGNSKQLPNADIWQKKCAYMDCMDIRTPGKRFSASTSGPSYGCCGDDVELSELLSWDEAMLEFIWVTFADINWKKSKYSKLKKGQEVNIFKYTRIAKNCCTFLKILRKKLLDFATAAQNYSNC